MSGLKPSNIKRIQKEEKTPLLYSSAFGEPRTNALGRRYKLSKGKDYGSKYYEQPNGSWSLNIPKVSLTPGSAEPALAEIEPSKEVMMNEKDPQLIPRFIPKFPRPSELEANSAPVLAEIEPSTKPIMNGKNPQSRPSAKSIRHRELRRFTRKHCRTYRK